MLHTDLLDFSYYLNSGICHIEKLVVWVHGLVLVLLYASIRGSMQQMPLDRLSDFTIEHLLALTCDHQFSDFA